MKVNANKDNVQVVFQLFNGWIEACMNYIYIYIPNFLGYWYYLDSRGMSYSAEEICPFQCIYGIGNVELETMCLDTLIDHTIVEVLPCLVRKF